MLKRCKCGKMMTINLRTIIYSNKVEIENVPVYSCDDCEYHEMCAEVKGDLTKIIQKLEHPLKKQLLSFNDINEFAWVMNEISDLETSHLSAEEIVKDRINQLLDLLLLASSLQDRAWVDDIQHRLRQITNHIPLATLD